MQVYCFLASFWWLLGGKAKKIADKERLFICLKHLIKFSTLYFGATIVAFEVTQAKSLLVDIRLCYEKSWIRTYYIFNIKIVFKKQLGGFFDILIFAR